MPTYRPNNSYTYKILQKHENLLHQMLTKSPAVARVGPLLLVVTDLADHPKSMTFVSSERAYAISY